MRHPTAIVRHAVLLACLCTLSACGEGDGDASPSPSGIEAELICSITFGVVNESSFSNLEATLRLEDLPGAFRTNGRLVDCKRLLPRGDMSVLTGCYHVSECEYGDAHEMVISYAGSGAPPVEGPTDLVRCRFDAEHEPAAPAFDMEVVDVATADLSPPAVWPVVGASDIECRASGSSTTSTSSTLPDCATCAAGEHCYDGECVADGTFEVEFSLANDVTFGGLQIEVDYGCTLGSIVGEGSDTRCITEKGLSTSAAFNDRLPDDDPCSPDLVPDPNDPVERAEFGAGLVSLFGTMGPTRLFTCRFFAAGRAPLPSDFHIRLIEGTAPDITELDPPPVVSVSRVVPTE